MKLIGNLLLTVCLITGCLSAATAYMAPTSSDDDAGLLLGDSAGAIPPTAEDLAKLKLEYEAGQLSAEAYVAESEATTPIVKKPEHGDVALTPEELDALRAADVKYVHTKEFSLSRWPHAIIFGLSAVGLLAGSLLVRAGDKAEIAKHADADTGTSTSVSPAGVMQEIGRQITALRDELPALPTDHDRLKTIMTRLGALQNDQIPTFVETRPQLIAAFSLGGYAEIMDRFAVMERQVNRAWSAAADGHLPEATRSLSAAAELAPEVQSKL